MSKITGPIKFSKGKEIPQKLKDHIKEHGLDTPFGKDFSYSNTKLDDWLRVKNEDGIFKLDRSTKKMVSIKDFFAVKKG